MNKIITISREYGAGGHSIGQQVAKELGIPFYDQDILRETAKASGFEIEMIEKEEEEVSKTNAILRAIAPVSGSYYKDTQDTIHEIQKAIILRFAKQGPCVILGRCADVILKEAGIDSFNVFIHADDVHCAVRVGEMMDSKNATEIQKLIARKGSSRRNYYNRYTGKKWGDSHNYDLTLDSGTLGYDLCVKLITESVNQMED